MKTNPATVDPACLRAPVVTIQPAPSSTDEQVQPVRDKEFDAYAAQYESALNEGLSVSGESPEYFARKRIEWTSRVLPSLDNIRSVLDFGCGVGIATPLIRYAFKPDLIFGFDPSTAAIERAQQEFSDSGIEFTASAHAIPELQFDLAYCNGVFHHILPADRDFAFSTVLRSLRPGGWFAFWENNPWNPGTRYVMSKIPFDRDAVVISPSEAKSLLKTAGFVIVRRDAHFLFPRSLGWLRPLEKLLHRIPIGAQYLVLAQKSESA